MTLAELKDLLDEKTQGFSKREKFISSHPVFLVQFVGVFFFYVIEGQIYLYFDGLPGRSDLKSIIAFLIISVLAVALYIVIFRYNFYFRPNMQLFFFQRLYDLIHEFKIMDNTLQWNSTRKHPMTFRAWTADGIPFVIQTKLAWGLNTGGFGRPMPRFTLHPDTFRFTLYFPTKMTSICRLDYDGRTKVDAPLSYKYWAGDELAREAEAQGGPGPKDYLAPLLESTGKLPLKWTVIYGNGGKIEFELFDTVKKIPYFGDPPLLHQEEHLSEEENRRRAIRGIDRVMAILSSDPRVKAEVEHAQPADHPA